MRPRTTSNATAVTRPSNYVSSATNANTNSMIQRYEYNDVDQSGLLELLGQLDHRCNRSARVPKENLIMCSLWRIYGDLRGCFGLFADSVGFVIQEGYNTAKKGHLNGYLWRIDNKWNITGCLYPQKLSRLTSPIPYLWSNWSSFSFCHFCRQLLVTSLWNLEFVS